MIDLKQWVNENNSNLLNLLVDKMKIAFNNTGNDIIDNKIVNLLYQVADEGETTEMKDLIKYLNDELTNVDDIIQLNGKDKLTTDQYDKLEKYLKEGTTTPLQKTNKCGIIIYRKLQSKRVYNDMMIYFPIDNQEESFSVGGNINTSTNPGVTKPISTQVKINNVKSWDKGFNDLISAKRERNLIGLTKYTDAYHGMFHNRPCEALNIKKTVAKNFELLLNCYRDAKLELYKDDIILFIYRK